MRIFYSPEAIEDLKRLREFIEPKNPPAAQRAAESIMKGIGQLHEFPLIGTEVRSAPDPSKIRDLVIGKYIARYLVGRTDVYVLRIWHHRENRSE